VALSRRTGRSRFTLVVLVLASITILTLDFRGSGPVDGLRSGADSVFSPVRGVADSVAEQFSNAWGGVTGYDDLERENERLRRRIDTLEGQQIGDEVARRQIAELKRQLGIRSTTDLPTAAARVISGPLTSFDATLEIDRGSGDGVKEGMAVATDAGLVGRVARVTGGRSQIVLITDPSFALGIRLAEQGDVGIARGTGQDGTLEVDRGISRDTTVKRGDAVITSGLEGSAFPPDLPVGRVRSVGRTADRTEKTLVLEPAADLRGLGYVTVLLCDENCS